MEGALGVEVRNCSRCGKVFVYTGNRQCPSCYREEEALFQQVDKYLREHPGANLEMVAGGTNIPKETILEFIRRGRLVTLKAEGLLRCEICGRQVDKGRICSDCARELTQGLAKKAMPPTIGSSGMRRGDRMHIADLLQKKGKGR